MDEVMAVAPVQWAVGARESAPFVSDDERSPERGRDGPSAPADVDRLDVPGCKGAADLGQRREVPGDLRVLDGGAGQQPARAAQPANKADEAE